MNWFSRYNSGTGAVHKIEQVELGHMIKAGFEIEKNASGRLILKIVKETSEQERKNKYI